MASEKTKAAQEIVPIKEIRDGVVVLQDGSMRAVLLTSSVNFALKSNDERASILYQFKNLLNSLDFSIQIVIQSRKLDIRPYIATLEARMKEQVIDLLKLQTKEYVEFIKKFTEDRNIMKKSFYVIVPYSGKTQTKQGISRLPIGKKAKNEKMESESFEEARSQLEQRINIVEQGLKRSGVRSQKLDTPELVELYYNLYNPGDTEKPIAIQ